MLTVRVDRSLQQSSTMTFLKPAAFIVWLCAASSTGPPHASAFVPIRSFVAQQQIQQNQKHQPTSTSSSQDENDPWETLTSTTKNVNIRPPQPQQQPIDTVAISSQDEKLKADFPAPPQPQTPSQPEQESMSTAMSAPRTFSREAAAVAPIPPTRRKVVFTSDGGMMYQELLPKATTKPKRLVPYQSNTFQQDGGMMFEDRRGSVPRAQSSPERPVPFMEGAFTPDSSMMYEQSFKLTAEKPLPPRPQQPLLNAFQPDQGMMFEARTRTQNQAMYQLPEAETKPEPRSSVFSNDGGMMYAAKLARGKESLYEAKPVPQVQKRPSVFSSDGGMMFAARTVPGKEVPFESQPVPQVQKRPTVFASDGGMMFAARKSYTQAPLPPRLVDPIKGAFTPENGGMMYAVRQKTPENPTPERPVVPVAGVFSKDSGMMFEAKTKTPDPPTTKRLVPYRSGVFSSDQGMMLEAKTKTPEAPAAKRLVPYRPGVFSSDQGMMFEAKQKKVEVSAPKRLVPYRQEAFGNDGGMMYQEQNSASSRLMLSPKVVDAVETSGQSFASFGSDGGIHMEAKMAEKPVVKNPNPSALLAESPKPNDDMSFAFKDVSPDKRLYLNPKVADAIETKGQSFAAFSSDGGIQMLTQLAQKPLAKNPAPVVLGYQLLAAGSDKMSFKLDRGDSSDKRRFFIPPKVAKASETIGQHFAAFSSDGGIQMVTKTAPSSVGPDVVNPMDASFLHYERSRATADFDSDGLQYVQHSSQRGKYLPSSIAEKVETTGQSFASFQSDGGIQKIARSNSTLFWAQ